MPNETTTPKKATAGPARAAADPTSTGATPAASAADPAGAAIADAARNAEIEQLTKQRDELRELVGEASTLEMLRAEVDALQQVAVRGGVTRSTRWTMSAGVAGDLEMRGYAVDPTNGDAYVRDGDRVKVTSRTGATRTVDMPASATGDTDAADRKS